MHLLAQIADTSQADYGQQGFWLTIVAVVLGLAVGIMVPWIKHLYGVIDGVRTAYADAESKRNSEQDTSIRSLLVDMERRGDEKQSELRASLAKVETKIDAEQKRQHDNEKAVERKLTKLEGDIKQLAQDLKRLENAA